MSSTPILARLLKPQTFVHPEAPPMPLPSGETVIVMTANVPDVLGRGPMAWCAKNVNGYVYRMHVPVYLVHGIL